MPMRKATVPGGASAVIRPASPVLLIVGLLSVARRTDSGRSSQARAGAGSTATTPRGPPNSMWTPETCTPQHERWDTVNMVEGPDAARRYHHGNLRAALIDTAVEQARAGGADAVVLRDAARRTGVSHNAAYRHFTDRDDLLAEVSERGMAELEQRMRDRLADLPDDDRGELASARLRAAGREDVRFALAEPGLFVPALACARPKDGAPGEGPYGVLSTVLDELVTTGVLPAERRPGADVTCWAAVHGFAVLCLQGPLADVSEREREAQLDGLLERLSRGL